MVYAPPWQEALRKPSSSSHQVIAMKPWDGIVSEQDEKQTFAAGFGRPGGVGKRPALLIIDVQYRTIGTTPKPFFESIKEYPTSCGEVGWNAMRNIAVLLAEFRRNDWPVLYPHVAPKNKATDSGRLAEKVPAIMDREEAVNSKHWRELETKYLKDV